jgi:hypothetical protein
MKPVDRGHEATVVLRSPSAEAERDTVPDASGEGRKVERHARAGGYEVGELLGKGGMGEVLLARDREIGRDVALKRVRSGLPPQLVDRFLREAKIQARLDHPAIVPVHEIGTDAEGSPYFTMKRLAGTTLAARLRDGGPSQPLLRAFVDVCLAIEFAHARGVVHRDLKPANIMLGDYGEVYVLDWGIARVAGDSVTVGGDIVTLEGHTQAGAVLGTPGYMAPEQAMGEQVTVAADIYALGCILFEILAGEPLARHPGAIVPTTDSPAARSPERRVAPELDAACTAALSTDPTSRPTARELADRVQRFLDGDRDLERRRALAAAQVDEARAALASGDPQRRADAARAAGRAVALDPDNERALDLVTTLVLDPPARLPAELVSVLAADETDLDKQRSAAAIPGYVALLAWLPLLYWIHVRSWPWFAVYVGGIFVMVAFLAYNRRTGRMPLPVMMAAMFAFVIVLSRLAGLVALTPVFVCAAAIALASRPPLAARPAVILGWTLAALVVPFVLEAAGILDATWQISADGIVLRSTMIGIDTEAGAYTLLAGTILTVMAVTQYATRLARDRADAQRRSRIQAWHLEQLLPRASSSATMKV